MSLKMFRFSVENMTTREKTAFIGDGECVLDALKEGMKNTAQTSRFKENDNSRSEVGLAVRLPSGGIVFRKLADFEGDVPWAAPATNELDFPE